jgi:large subunit ribosomal protein L25
MRKDITIAATTRATRGKNEARRLRVKGQAPAVLYGTGQDAVALAINPKDVTKILHSDTGHNTIFNMTVDGSGSQSVMIVDWQFEPIKGALLHADLLRIDLQQKIRVKVPVHTSGEAKGVKQQGGILEIVAREVEIECLPDDIPAHYELVVTNLTVGQNVRASDLTLQASAKLLSNPEMVLVHVIGVRAEDAAADAAAKAEPEVIKKGKKEDPAAAGKAAAPAAKAPAAKKK